MFSNAIIAPSNITGECWNSASTSSVGFLLAATLAQFTQVRNPTLFITIALITLLPFTQAAEVLCSDGDKPLAVHQMCKCSQYKDSTCCPTQYSVDNYLRKFYEHTVYASYIGCVDSYPIAEHSNFACEPNEECAALVEQLSCAKTCSPLQETYKHQGDFAICHTKADQLWKACKDSEIYTSNSTHRSCTPLTDTIPDRDSFIASLSSSNIVFDNTTDCWNGASTFLVAPALAISAMLSKRPVLILFVLAIFSTSMVSAGMCNSGVPSTQLDNACFCPMYDDTCCPSYSVPQKPLIGNSGSSFCSTISMDDEPSQPCEGIIEPACADALFNMGCAKLCSPNQFNITDTKGNIKICKSQANKLYDACASSTFYNSTTGKCFVVSSLYKNISQWFDGQFDPAPEIVDPAEYGYDETICWNGSPSTSLFIVIVSLIGLHGGSHGFPLFLAFVLIASLLPQTQAATPLILVSNHGWSGSAIFKAEPSNDITESPARDVCIVSGFNYECHLNDIIKPTQTGDDIDSAFLNGSTIYYLTSAKEVRSLADTTDSVNITTGNLVFNSSLISSGHPHMFGVGNMIYIYSRTFSSENLVSRNMNDGVINSVTISPRLVPGVMVQNSSIWFLSDAGDFYFCSDSTDCVTTFNTTIQGNITDSYVNVFSAAQDGARMLFWAQDTSGNLHLLSVDLPFSPGSGSISSPTVHYTLNSDGGSIDGPDFSTVLDGKLWFDITWDMYAAFDYPDGDYGSMPLPTGTVSNSDISLYQSDYDETPIQVIGKCTSCSFDKSKPSCCAALFNGSASYSMTVLLVLLALLF